MGEIVARNLRCHDASSGCDDDGIGSASRDRLGVELEGTPTGYTTAWNIQVLPGPARRDLDSVGAVLP